MLVVVRKRYINILTHIDTVRIPASCFVHPPNCANLSTGIHTVERVLRIATWNRNKYRKEIITFPYIGLCICRAE